MAIEFDAVSSGATGGATSLTVSHTCSGLNRILFVGVIGSYLGDYITGATYNSVAMTLVDKQQISGDRWVYLYYLIAPALGTNNIVVSSSPSDYILLKAVSYIGALQSSQPDKKTKGSATGTTQTANVTTGANNCWMVGMFDPAGGGATAGAGTFLRVSDVNQQTIFDSNGSVGTSGSHSLIVNNNVSVPYAYVACSFLPLNIGLLNGVKAYWKLDEASGNPADSSGNGITLTNTGVTFGAGKISNCAIFAGGTSKLTCAVPINFNSNFTVAFWVYISTSGVNNWFLNFGGYGDGTNGAISLLVTTINTPRWSYGAWFTEGVTGAPYSLVTSTWNHLVFQRSGTTLNTYVNGALFGTPVTTSISNIPTTGTLFLGEGPEQSSSTPYSGYLDEVGIWNRVLSASEVKQLYNFNNGLPYPLNFAFDSFN